MAEFVDMQDQMKAPPPPVAPAEAIAADRNVIDQYLGDYTLGPGDVVSVTLTGATEAPVPAVQVRLDDQGEVDLPIVGKIKIQDMTLSRAEDAIQAAYVPGVVPQAVVNLEMISTDTTDVLVVGAVQAPGLVPLRRTQRDMLHAIVGAGGITQDASGQASLRRIRADEEVVLDLTHPDQLKMALALRPLESGDIVRVHAAPSNTVYVGGLVRGAAPQSYPQGSNVTLLQALAAAGGVKTEVYPKEATLIRRMPDGHDVHVKLDLARLQRGEDPNIMLAAGDILWVPETFGTTVMDFINRNIFLRAGVTVNYTATGVEYLNRASQQSGGGDGGSLQDIVDPFGYLQRGAAIRGLGQR